MGSGFVYEEDGSMLYLVNVTTYDLVDDESCFDYSCRFHGIHNKKLDKTYEIMKANCEYTEGYNVMLEFKKDGEDEYRVYKVLER